MHTLEIPATKRKVFIPSDLSECTPQQYIDISELILAYQTQKLTFEEFKIQAIYRLINLKVRKNKDSENTTEKTLTNIQNLSNLIDTFFDNVDQASSFTIKQNFIHNPVPKIKLWRTYKGPKDAFENITFGQYIDAHRLLLDFSATADFDNLYLIAAIFYLPKKWLSSKTKPYQGETVEERAKTFKFLPVGFVYGAFLWFTSFQKWLATAEIPFAGRNLDFSIVFGGSENETTEQNPSIGMDSIVHTIAESGVYGNKEQTLKANLWDVLIRIYDVTQRNIEQQNQYEKSNTK